MNVELTIAVYQRKESGELSWTTLGLGEHNETVRGHSAVKTQRRLVSKLRGKLRELDGADLEQFQLRRGLRLHRTRLEVVVGEGMGRSRVSGVFPLVVEPRRASASQRVLVVYHPNRQDEWLFVESESEIAEAAQAYFRKVWKDLERDEVEALRTAGKDGIKPVAFSASVRGIDAPDDKEDRRGRRRRETDVLSQIGTNQTTRAIEGTLPLGMPRRALARRMWLLLSGASKRSTVLLGAPKSGKSTVIAQWVTDLLAGDDYNTHHNLDRIHKVWRVSGKRLIAGMSHLGDWEQRCLDLMQQVKKTRAVLWVDDIHLWGKLGQSRESERSFADFFRGPVARGELVVVAECTREQLLRLEDDAPSFAKLLTQVLVPAASHGETLQMLVHEGSRLELEAGCRVHPFTYRTILEMGASLFPWTAFPGKAIDLLQKLVEPALSVAPGESVTPQTIESSAVIDLLSKQTGLPQSLLTLDRGLDVEALGFNLEARVMGQPRATRAATDLVCRIRAGLTDPKRPYAVLLFTGPTGTGKTELAKQIAQFLYGDISRLVRFDMSEYASPDAVPRLIGDRFSPQGQLTRRIREQPFSVLLLDEIEKAHRSVLNLLLQLFDDARLTDAAGDTTSFANAVIIMTSNLGARPTRPVGFGDLEGKVMADIERAVAAFFPPELFNRIDQVVPFSPLSPAVAEAVVVKELATLFSRRGMKERNIFVYAAAAVKERIVQDAFDERWGARTVKRYLEDRIGSLLAEHISARGRSSMQVIRLYAAEEEEEGSASPFRIHADPLDEAEPYAAASVTEPLIEAPSQELARHAREVGDRLGVALADLGRWREEARDVAALRYYVDWYEERAQTIMGGLGGDDADVQADVNARTWAGAHGERLRFSPKHKRLEGREAVLRRLLEGIFLATHADALGDPGAHEARIELLSINHGRGSTGPVSTAGGGRLIGHLVQAYGELLEVGAVALRHADGTVTESAAGEVPLATLARGFVDHVVLDVAGFAVQRRLAGEQGCHIRRSAAAEPEIVRVRVMRTGGAPAELLRGHRAAVATFDRALEAGTEPLPDNPTKLLPAVRTLSYSMPLRTGGSFAVEIEDFRESYSETMAVRSLRQVVERLWQLRAGRRS